MTVSFTTTPGVGSEAPANFNLYTGPLSDFGSPYSFSFRTAASSGPFLYNIYPTSDQYSVDGNTDISMYILDGPNFIQENTIRIYINGSEIFDGSTETFFAPWNGAGSYVRPVSVDSYEGYVLLFKHTEMILPRTKKTISVTALNQKGLGINFGRTDPSLPPNPYWFRTGTEPISLSVGNYETCLNMLFGEKMNIPSLLTTTAYPFDNNMYVRHVDLNSSASLAKLWVEGFYGSDTFTLSDFSAIFDQYGNAIPNSYLRSFSVTPFQSSAQITTTNNLLRTWYESNIVQTDTQRAYFATTKGIEVFKRMDEKTVIKWAQIFDGYKINAMYVVNFGGELPIIDNVPPYLTNQNPLPSGFISSNGTIHFTVADATTAPDLSTVHIYINGAFMFNADDGGSRLGYIVDADVQYKSINFSIKSETGFVGPTILIRVIASDIVGNRLDTSYSLSVV